MIEILAAVVPNNWLIYVKEHPYQWLPRGAKYFDYRYAGFYEKIQRIKNVRLVPVTTDTFTLIERAQTVATITGTAGWEAVLRGKSALCFGYSWYRHCPGIWRVNDAATCRAASTQAPRRRISR